MNYLAVQAVDLRGRILDDFILYRLTKEARLIGDLAPFMSGQGHELASASFEQKLVYGVPCGARHVAGDAVSAVFHDDLFTARRERGESRL